MRLLLLVVCLVPVWSAEIPATAAAVRTVECEFYDPSCVEDGGDDCRGTKNCYDQPDADRQDINYIFQLKLNYCTTAS